MQNLNQEDRKPTAPQTEEEKLEFLRREEIRTMIKDVSKLRELEAQKERERLATIKPPVKEKEIPQVPPPPSPTIMPRYSNIPPQPVPQRPVVAPPQNYQAPQQAPARPAFAQPAPAQQVPTQPAPARPAPAQPQPAPQPSSVPILPKMPGGISAMQKILVRTIAIAVLIFIIAFICWYFLVKMPGEKKKEPVATTTDQIVVEGETTTTATSTTTATTTVDEVLETKTLSITERIINWGYYIPTATRTIDTIIILSTMGLGKDPYSLDGIIQESKRYNVSPHYLIAREGTIYRLVPDKYVAYQAGAGQMPDGSRKDIINNFSIGIELVYAKTEYPAEAQYQSLAQLVKYLKQQYSIPSENILGHNEIAPERKTDPWNFDWVKFDEMLK